MAAAYPKDPQTQNRYAYDGLGRPVLTKVLDASLASYSIVETQYDPLGRPYKVSNPHNSTAQYWTETRFDGLGRPVKVIPPDGTATSNNTSYAYATNTLTVTDPANKQRKSSLDALGRLLKVTEPDSGGSLTVDANYTYTVLDALAQVSEGLQTRTYNYDGMGRLTSTITPEAGTVSYQYNNFDLATQRTDARGVITTYGYDTLNRLTSLSYNVGSTGVPATPTVTFGYDAGGAAANALGRLTSMTDGVGGGRRRGSCICGCSCWDLLCVLSGILFGCKSPPGCKETIYASPGPAGNQCAGLIRPHDFLEEWSCEGDVPCCREKQTAYLNRCYDRGRGRPQRASEFLWTSALVYT